MRRARDLRTPVWLTELSWPAAEGKVRGGTLGFETTDAGQARRLRAALRLLGERRRTLRIGKVVWYTWLSEEGGAQLLRVVGAAAAARRAAAQRAGAAGVPGGGAAAEQAPDAANVNPAGKGVGFHRHFFSIGRGRAAVLHLCRWERHNHSSGGTSRGPMLRKCRLIGAPSHLGPPSMRGFLRRNRHAAQSTTRRSTRVQLARRPLPAEPRGPLESRGPQGGARRGVAEQRRGAPRGPPRRRARPGGRRRRRSPAARPRRRPATGHAGGHRLEHRQAEALVVARAARRPRAPA